MLEDAGRRPQRNSQLATRLERIRIPARIAYLGILLLATLSSLDLDVDPGRMAFRLRRMLQPTVSLSDAIDGARNVTLFAGWGLVWMATGAGGRSLVLLRNAVLTGGAISVFVEAVQLASSRRTASLLDFVTNTGGSLVGALVLVAVVVTLARTTDRRSFVGVPALLFALCYGVAVVAESLIPLFRQDLASPVSGALLGRLSRGIDEFSWTSVAELPVGDFLLFLPAGVFAVAALYEAGMEYRRAGVVVGAGALPVFVAAEVLHALLGIPIQAGAVLVHAGGVATGAALSARWLPVFTRRVRGPARPRWLTRGYVAVVAAWTLRPYVPELNGVAIATKVTAEWWVPLRALGRTMTFFTVVDVLVLFLLFLPLGGLLAVWPLRARGRLAGFAPALYLAIAFEVGQIFIAGRSPDITDLLVQSAAAAIGWTVVRRAGFRPYGSQLAERR